MSALTHPPAPAPAPAPIQEVHAVAADAPALAAAPIEELPAAAASTHKCSQMATKADYDIVELDADELLREQIYYCKIFHKSFRRDDNLRMNMRAHGDRYKTLGFLYRPKPPDGREVRFFCPFKGCNRNHGHPSFWPLKTAACARYHFRCSHCPKLYPCKCCSGNKRFAALADLRRHLRHCGKEERWRCSCSTTFSRRDKLSRHITLFEGHTLATTEPNKEVVTEPTEALVKPMERVQGNASREEDEEVGNDPEFFKELMEEFRGDARGSTPTGPAGQ